MRERPIIMSVNTACAGVAPNASTMRYKCAAPKAEVILKPPGCWRRSAPRPGYSIPREMRFRDDSPADPRVKKLRDLSAWSEVKCGAVPNDEHSHSTGDAAPRASLILYECRRTDRDDSLGLRVLQKDRFCSERDTPDAINPLNALKAKLANLCNASARVCADPRYPPPIQFFLFKSSSQDRCGFIIGITAPPLRCARFDIDIDSCARI